MARLRADYVFGTTTAALTTTTTTLSSAALARLPVVAGGDTAAVTLIDDTAGTYEMVWVTAHTSGATTATITRGQEGSTAANWVSGSKWVHGPTAHDVGSPIALVDVGAATPTDLVPGTLVLEKGRGPAAAILADAPVAYYKLDETTGVFADSSGGGRDMTAQAGTVRGAASINPYDGGFSASSGGTNHIAGWAPGTNIAGLQTSGPHTMECRVRIPAGTVSYKGAFFAFGAATNGWSMGIGNGRPDVAGNRISLGRHGLNWVDSGFALTPGDYHFAAAKLITDTLAIYMNGELLLTLTGFQVQTPTTTGLNIGGIVGDGSANLSAAIAVDDVAFYDKALQPGQIRRHYASGGTRVRGWWDGTTLQPLAQ